jgi:molybdopterin-guanine dinucleotide biosynthesis protein A
MDVRMAAILAGGRGRRLGGVHKGLLTVGGRSILERQLEALAPWVAERCIVAGDLSPYAAVASAHGALLVPDRAPGQGPLAGLEAALGAGGGDALLVFACDLPFLDAELIRALRDAPDAEAVVPRIAGRAQPLAARYARAILPKVQARLARGALRLSELVDELAVVWLDLADAPPGFFNVNTPADLERAEAWLKT